MTPHAHKADMGEGIEPRQPPVPRKVHTVGELRQALAATLTPVFGVDVWGEVGPVVVRISYPLDSTIAGATRLATAMRRVGEAIEDVTVMSVQTIGGRAVACLRVVVG